MFSKRMRIACTETPNWRSSQPPPDLAFHSILLHIAPFVVKNYHPRRSGERAFYLAASAVKILLGEQPCHLQEKRSRVF